MFPQSYAVLQWNMNSYRGSVSTSQPAHDDSADTTAVANDADRVKHLQALLVDSGDPDVVVLQEAPEAARKALVERGYVVWARDGHITALRSSSNWLTDRRVETALYPRAIVSAVESVQGAPRGRLVIWNVHLRSRTGGTQDTTIENEALKLRDAIFRVRGTLGPGFSEIVAGDFNLHPFASALMHHPPTGLGGGRCIEACVSQAARESFSNRPLVNSAWVLLGRTETPCASYYYQSGNQSDAPWYQYDQVMFSADLIDGRAMSVQLIMNAGSTPLCASGRFRYGRKDVASDHLPVLVKLGDPKPVDRVERTRKPIPEGEVVELRPEAVQPEVKQGARDVEAQFVENPIAPPRVTGKP